MGMAFVNAHVFFEYADIVEECEVKQINCNIRAVFDTLFQESSAPF